MTEPATPEDLFAVLDGLGIPARTHLHRPVRTVAESRDLKAGLPGGHTKNLFLKDKQGRLFLVVADRSREQRPIALRSDAAPSF